MAANFQVSPPCRVNMKSSTPRKTLYADYDELTKEFRKGFSISNLQFMRRFYQSYQIQQTMSVKLSWSHCCELLTISVTDKRSFYKHDTDCLYFSLLPKNICVHQKYDSIYLSGRLSGSTGISSPPYMPSKFYE